MFDRDLRKEGDLSSCHLSENGDSIMLSWGAEGEGHGSSLMDWLFLQRFSRFL